MERLSAPLANEASVSAIVRHFCTVPDPFESYEQRERLLHLDLESLSREELRQELGALLWWLRIQRAPDPWFHDRVAQLRALVGHED